MFTGLVQAMGRIAELTAVEAGVRMRVDLGGWGHRPAPGDSIGVDGCCLTVTATCEGWAEFVLVPETLSKTTFGRAAVGRRVNLEHALTATSLVGGHFVQGHVDGVGRVVKVDRSEGWRVQIEPPAEVMAYCVPKGSVCVDGVSLTLARVEPAAGWFEVALIPETLERTTLGEASEGREVHIEGDMLAKTVVHFLRHYPSA
ncbi:MAG: riboflavin synthase [Phycisphaeraceae bacterium]|nr:riboflavin synthase [Phycisphaeraceae bacterium]